MNTVFVSEINHSGDVETQTHHVCGAEPDT